MDHGHAERRGGLRRARADPPPRDLDRAFEVGVNAGQNLDQRALAGPVFAGQHVDLARAQLEIDSFEHTHWPETFSDPLHADERLLNIFVRARHPAISLPTP